MKNIMIVVTAMVVIAAQGRYHTVFSQTCIRDTADWKLSFQKSSGDCISCHTVCTPGGSENAHSRFCQAYGEWGTDQYTCGRCHDDTHEGTDGGDGHWNGDSSTCSRCHGGATIDADEDREEHENRYDGDDDDNDRGGDDDHRWKQYDD